MKPLLLIILICLISLTAFAQEIHYSGEGKVTVPLGKEETDIKTQASHQYDKEIKAGIILPGMSEGQIIQAIGEPYHKSPYKNRSIWWYPDRKFIYFKDGKVTEATFPIGAPEGEL